MGLDLYAKIEPYLDFEDEVRALHKAFLGIVFEKDLNNILDIGCGQGAFLNHLKANAKTASGIDLSQEQINVCLSFGLDAQCTALENIHQKYDCLTAIFDVINYIPNEDIHAFFQAAYNALNPDGYFIFDTNSLFGFETVAQGCLNISLADKFIAIDAFFEEEKLQTDITFFTQGKMNTYHKEEGSITQYYYETEKLKETVQKAGFEIEKIMNFNLHSDEDADKLIFICKKPQ